MRRSNEPPQALSVLTPAKLERVVTSDYDRRLPGGAKRGAAREHRLRASLRLRRRQGRLGKLRSSPRRRERQPHARGRPPAHGHSDLPPQRPLANSVRAARSGPASSSTRTALSWVASGGARSAAERTSRPSRGWRSDRARSGRALAWRTSSNGLRRQNLTNLPVTNSDGRLVGLLLRVDAEQALDAIQSNAEAARPSA